jgi:2,3-bisphosphoglycerate-dependent phosphoglycerate mutase
MSRLVLMRHGQSTWNAQGRFTGWVDVGLTEIGMGEAVRAGAELRDRCLRPDVVHTSLLTRSILTANLALGEAGWLWVPQQRSWRLNERHYGALAGRNRDETAAVHGADAVLQWRRSYRTRPPETTDNSAFTSDPRYSEILATDIPVTESLADVEVRLLPYWYDAILPDLDSGRNVLIVAHGNSLRALTKHLEGLSESAVELLEIPTASPRVYEVERTGPGAAVSVCRV